MFSSQSYRTRAGASRGLVIALLIAAAIVAAAYGVAILRRPPVDVPPLAQDAAEPAVAAGTLPKIPFRDITATAGIQFVHRGGATGEKMLPESGGSGCAFVDYDNDGDPDLVLVSGKAWPWNVADPPPDSNSLALYRNDGERFADVTNDVGLAADIYGQGVADGDDDLFFTAVGGNRLFRNDAGRFTDVTAETGVAGSTDDWSTSTGFFDYDRDGDLDLFVCNYLRWKREIDQAATKRVPGEGLTYAHPANFDGVQNHLYRNDGGRFTDVAADAGIHVTEAETDKPLGKALAVAFVDFDQDGWLDVFVANDTVRHFLFHNQQDGKFAEVGESRGFALNAAGLTTSGMGIDAAWIHNDNQLAIAVSNFANEMTSLYVLQGKDDLFFTDETIPAGIGGPTRNVLTFGLLFDDFDLDGRVDLVETNGHLEETIAVAQPSQQYRQPAKLFWNAGSGAPRGPPDSDVRGSPDPASPQFVDLPAENIADLAKPIVGRALASADIDGDGDMDLAINQVAGPPLLLRNEQQLGGHWLRCKLQGPSGNRHAIGAVVELRAGGITQRRYVHPTRSYLSQTEPIATFGLGKSDAVESLVVNWPDGTTQQVQVDGVDQLVTVRQAAKAAAAGPSNASFTALANKAKALLENGEFEKSVPVLQQALEMRPDSAAMRRNLARAYTLSGQPALALAELQRLAAASSQPSPAIEYLSGLAALRQLRNEEAAEHFRKAIELDPNEATLRFQYGLALTALGRSDEARGQFEKAVELDPLHGGAQYQLATIARKAGDQETFTRLMRDFQRIRGIKGPADPQSLEACRYTKAEPPEIAAKPPPAAGSTASFDAIAPDGQTSQPADIAGLAVLSMDDAGCYRSVAVTREGDILVLDCDQAGRFKEITRTEQPIGAVGDSATLLVGNAFVDAGGRPAARAGEQTDRQGDQPEIAIVTPQQTWLVRNTPDSGIENLTTASNLSAAGGDAARWVDLDHDGDIDLCVASATGLRVWRNNSDGRFVEATKDFGLTDVGPCVDFAAVDFDMTNLGVDLIVTGPSGSSLYRNQFAGRLARDELFGASWPPAARVLADDLNNDGPPDLVFMSNEGATVIVTGRDERQQINLGLDQIDAATTIDVDNDGWLDVAVAGRSVDVPKIVMLRNTGGRFADPPVSLPSPTRVRSTGLLDADVDDDGHTDLTLVGADGNLVLLRNETPTENRQLKLALRSFVGSPSSIGVRVQVRSGDHVVTRWTSRELPIEIGMGQSTQADSIQTLWLNGIAKNEIGVALSAEPVRVTIVEFVRSSSCPFLYAWIDGGWRFVTDLLGTAPLNVSVSRGVPMPPDPDEVVILGPAERFGDDDAAARIRVTSELREVVYLDQARLLAVDHPAGTAVFSCDRASPTAVSGQQVVAGRNAIAPRSAIGSDGIDRTQELAMDDGVFARPGRVLPPPVIGFTEPLTIELDFGELTRSHAPRGNAAPGRSASDSAVAAPQSGGISRAHAERGHEEGLLLALTGWFKFGNSSTNIAASQRGDLQVVWPRLEASGADGSWHVVEEIVGLPAGNTKTIVCNLADKLPPGAHRLRLTTSFEVRWDRIALYETVPDGELRITEIAPLAADLQWHGFAELRPHADDQPQIPNLARVSDTAPWFTSVAGWCTRYGDILPLVTDADPMMAIFNSGDGATIQFSTRMLPAREPGTERTLALYTRGWIKEADPNTLPDRRVEPLPVDGVAVVRGSPDPARPSDWQLEYNTRWVPQYIGQEVDRSASP